jgi:hypothetical protein
LAVEVGIVVEEGGGGGADAEVITSKIMPV